MQDQIYQTLISNKMHKWSRKGQWHRPNAPLIWDNLGIWKIYIWWFYHSQSCSNSLQRQSQTSKQNWIGYEIFKGMSASIKQKSLTDGLIWGKRSALPLQRSSSLKRGGICHNRDAPPPSFLFSSFFLSFCSIFNKKVFSDIIKGCYPPQHSEMTIYLPPPPALLTPLSSTYSAGLT